MLLACIVSACLPTEPRPAFGDLPLRSLLDDRIVDFYLPFTPSAWEEGLHYDSRDIPPAINM